MTLQERMIAVYLRQANLPPEEKGKLRLFLGLLLETMEKDDREAPSSAPVGHLPPEGEGCAEQSRAEQSRAEQSRAPAMPATTFSSQGAEAEETTTPPAPMGATSPDKGGRGKPADPLEKADASAAVAKPSSAGKAGGGESGMKDPLAYEILERLEQENKPKSVAAKEAGINQLTLQKFLDGGMIRKETRGALESWMAPWRAAKEILG